MMESMVPSRQSLRRPGWVVRRTIAVAAFCVLPAAACVADGGAAGRAIDVDSLEKLAAGLAEQAEKQVGGEPTTDGLETELAAVVYDKDGLNALRSILARQPAETSGLYVVDKLLDPLLSADPSVVRAARHGLLNLLMERFVRYLPLPRYPAAQLRRLQHGEYDPNMATEAVLRQMATVEEARSRKAQSETPVQRHNELAGSIERKVYRLMLQSDEVQTDRELILSLVRAESSRDHACLKILDAITGRAPSMPPEQAERIHEDLTRLLDQWQLKTGSYVRKDAVIVSRSDNSSYASQSAYWGIDLPRVLNLLAPALGKEQLPVPGEDALNKLIKQRAQDLLNSRQQR